MSLNGYINMLISNREPVCALMLRSGESGVTRGQALEPAPAVTAS